MKWTKDLPTKPGYYWFGGHLGRDGDKTNGQEIVRILHPRRARTLSVT